MHTEYHRWFSHRLGRDMGIVVFGHWGPPLVTFPTSGGNEWEMRDQGVVATLAEFVDAGRLKIFSLNHNASESFYNKGAHPYHRSWMQRMYDEYVREEVVPFVHNHCRSLLPISVMGPSLGAYYAANSLFKHPDVFKRCFALSGVYDMRGFMNGMYDDNFYFNNPVDYLSNLADPWHYEQLASCDIHLVTGHGPWENSGPARHLSGILRSKGIRHSLDDWGPEGGHDWPYWRHQMWEYVSKIF
ncbi:MAG: putative hydrolase of the alpha/beta superfamily protein [Acidobacteria bacterium]|jgi:esterase/lipase superfamily enzyme|nr:putative hydrolase of the alpha/beta superfamily protein [Acidobacteriota bacterium]